MIHHRPLTSAERAALPPGLAAVVPVSEVLLVGRHHPLSTLSQMVRGYALIVVRGRRIFWPDLPADLSVDAARLPVLAHEVVHVWQYETGMTLVSYIWRDVILRLGRYAYRLRPGKPYRAYGYEQQAAMVEDWMRLRAGRPPQWCHGVDMAHLQEVVPFL